MIHICPLHAVEPLIRAHAPSHLLSLLNADMMIETPACIDKSNHLRIAMNDIARPETDMTEPGFKHAGMIIDFLRCWPQREALLIHCWAGISRSTAAAYIALCLLNEDESEDVLAKILRFHAPEATPNPLLVAHADAILERGGRMIAAIAQIGRGRYAFEGAHFTLPARIQG